MSPLPGVCRVSGRWFFEPVLCHPSRNTATALGQAGGGNLAGRWGDSLSHRFSLRAGLSLGGQARSGMDLSVLGTYAKVDNSAYRLIKNATPGPYTFILEATGEVPRRLLHPRRKTVGVRVPDNAITQALLAEFAEPIMSVTLQLPGDDYPLTDPYDIRTTLEHEVELVIDGGFCGLEPTTVIDLSADSYEVLREGLGDITRLALG